MSGQEQETAAAQPEDQEAARQATIARLAPVARQIDAGHIPAGVQMHVPGGRVITGPAEMPDREAGQ